jgi:hypothetical protein
MHYRRRNLAIFVTSSVVAATVGFNCLIDNHNQSDSAKNHSNELSSKFLEVKHHLADILLKKKDDSPYITVESTDALTKIRYQQALYYIKQTHSNNPSIREYGLSHLARLNNLPSTFYTILSQQLDYSTAIQLARTSEANAYLFPSGPPYIFTVANQKVLATDNANELNDDDILLRTIRQFLDRLFNDKQRPLDILSEHYLKLVRQCNTTTRMKSIIK